MMSELSFPPCFIHALDVGNFKKERERCLKGGEVTGDDR
jgi:hypothetical protein